MLLNDVDVDVDVDVVVVVNVVVVVVVVVVVFVFMFWLCFLGSQCKCWICAGKGRGKEGRKGLCSSLGSFPEFGFVLASLQITDRIRIANKQRKNKKRRTDEGGNQKNKSKRMQEKRKKQENKSIFQEKGRVFRCPASFPKCDILHFDLKSRRRH